MFENEFYPWNQNRATRVTQLGADCSHLAAEIATSKTNIESMLKDANDIIDNAYGGKAPESPGCSTLPSTEIDCVASELMNIALTTAGGAILTNSVLEGLTKAGFCISGIGGTITSAFVGLAAFAGVGAAVSALWDGVAGGVRKSTLQHMTISLVAARKELMYNALRSRTMLSKLSSIVASYRAMNSVASITEEQRNAAIQKMVDDSLVAIGSVTQDTANAELAAWDKQRQAWTEEDNIQLPEDVETADTGFAGI